MKAIKKGAETIINRGGIIRKFENLGYNKLPYRMKHHTEIFSEAKYLLVNNQNYFYNFYIVSKVIY